MCLCYRVVLRFSIPSLPVVSLLSCCFKVWYSFLTWCVFVIEQFKVWFISLPVVSLLSCCLRFGILSLPGVSLLSCCFKV